MMYSCSYSKMQVAIDEAVKAYEKGEVPVGAAIFLEDRLLASAHNLKESLKLATAHAEILAIDEACRKTGDWRLTGAELYVTAEPCFMCAGAILQARISSVHFGVNEPKFGGVISRANLFDVQTNHTVIYYGGERAGEISLLMQSFFKKLRDIRT